MAKPPARRQPPGSPVGPDDGFTLLEVLVAVAILSLSLTSLLGSQLASMQATRYARQLSAAAFLAEYQLIEIEWQQRRDGWQTNDITIKGDFDDQGWDDIEYECFVDFIELPEYNQMVQAKQAVDQATDGDDYYEQDAADTTFDALGVVWPMIKAAIENSIRRASCTVFWKNGKIEEEFNVVTFWTDPNGLTQLPNMGGEYTEGDDPSGEGGQGGSSQPGGGGAQPPGNPNSGGFGGAPIP